MNAKKREQLMDNWKACAVTLEEKTDALNAAAAALEQALLDLQRAKAEMERSRKAEQDAWLAYRGTEDQAMGVAA